MTGPNKHTILVVDDEPEVLHSLRRLLRAEFEVRTAQNGFEALEILKQHPVHVVMSDQRMPEMTGVQLLNQLEAERPEVRRVVFTGYADIRAVIDAINQGRVFRYITKPWDPDELITILHQACAEYDQLVARNCHLADLRAHVAQGLALAKGLQAGSYGALNAAGRSQVEKFTETGSICLGWLDQAINST